MPYTYEELKGKTVGELREIASSLEHDAVKGHSQMNKEHLLPALCKALGIDTREHHTVQGIDKAGIKAKIKMLKAERDKALDAHNHDSLKALRRQIHHLNRQIRGHIS
jgi:folylpolyglutamate synthase/dihydropteroate synthase